VVTFFAKLFDTSDFSPRWYCGHWTTEHGWLHIASDLAVWSAYLAIPLVLLYFASKRRDLPFRKIFLLFGAFILACGTTHLMEAIIFWWPAYRLAGLIKLFTGVVSWATVFALVPVVPQALRLRSPEALEHEIAARESAEDKLRQANAELERRVEALRASEEGFRLLVEGTKDYGMVLLDPQGNVVSWNVGAERIEQYRTEEIIGRHVSRFYRPEDVQAGKPQQELERATTDGKYEDEGIRVRKDGTTFWAAVLVTALRDNAGRLTGFSKITRDITAKRDAEEGRRRLLHEEAARQAAEEQADVIRHERESAERRAVELDAVIEGMPDAVVFGTAAGITRWNSNALKILGTAEPGELQDPLAELAQKFQVYRLDEARPLSLEELPFSRALNGETMIEYLVLRRVADRHEIDVRAAAAPIRSADRIIGAVAVISDVTAQKQAERQSRFLADVSASLVGPQHDQSVLRHVAEVAVPTLGDCCFFDILNENEQLDRVAWKHVDPAKALLTDRVRRFVPQKGTGHPVWQVVESGQTVFLPEFTDAMRQAIAVDDEHLGFLCQLNVGSLLSVPLLVGSRCLGALSFGYCESGRRHTPQDVELAGELARRVAMTVENARLLNQLRNADQKKNEFLAVLAHELRNPLAPITNALQIMRFDDGNATETARLREMMERQVQQMVHLVDDLLDVSRITSGKIVLRKEQLELGDVVGSAVEAVRPLIEGSKHDFSVTLPATPIRIFGDKTRLAQILSNLLANAAKYTPEGGRIWLTVTREGNEALLRVRDTGMGIPADMMPYIFEMFTQVDRHLGRSQGGLGIGLTLVRSLVEMHGGRIQAFSDGPGQGSEFVVSLPLPAEAAPAPRDDQGDGVRQNESGARRRILVVDDNKDSAETLGALLRIMKNEVKLAYDGPSALDAAASFRPHVVLLDIGLPGMSGYDVARRLRQMPETRDAYLIAQTGWGQEEDKRRAEQAGMNYHMVKPVDAAALRKLLASLDSPLNT
jgi:PAS domain S-box-containing protein